MKASPCPICHKIISGENIVSAKYYPFCSRRCQLVDLGHWFSDDYSIPGSSVEEKKENQQDGDNP